MSLFPTFLGFFVLNLGEALLSCNTQSTLVRSLPFSLNGTFAGSQNCEYLILFDDGTYPLVDITASNIYSNDRISLKGGEEGLLQPTNGTRDFALKTALLPAEFLSLTIETGSSTSLTVNIMIDQRNANLTANQLNFTLNARDQALSQSLKNLTAGENRLYSASSSGKVVVSLLAHPDPEESSKLMGFFIYENEELKGSLYQYQSKPYISAGNDVSIFIASDQSGAKSLLLIQNADNIANVNNFNTRWQYDVDSEGNSVSIEITATGTISKPAIFTIGRDADDKTDCYLNSINLTDSSTQVFVFSGSLADEDYELEHYTFSNIETNLPQQLPGSLKTFVVYGSATIQLAPFTSWSNAYIGRKGFLMTENYPFFLDQSYTTASMDLYGRSSEQLYFTMDTPKGDPYSHWLLHSDVVSSEGGNVNQSGSIPGNNFTVSLYVSTSAGNIGALARWSISEVPPTTTTVTTPTTTVNLTTTGNTTVTTTPAPSNTTVVPNETTTDWTGSSTTATFPKDDIFLSCNQSIFNLTDEGINGVFTLLESCNYTINIPTGFGARISISAEKLGQNETLTMRSDYGDYINSVNRALKADVTWAGDDFHIDAVIEENSKNVITLAVYKAEIKLGEPQKVYNLTTEGPQILDQAVNFAPLTTTVIRSNSKVYISSATPQTYNEASSLLVYEGEGDKATLVGSLYDLAPSGNTWTSASSVITIYSAHNGTFVNFAKYIFNEADVVKQYTGHHTWYTPDLLGQAWILTLNAEIGTDALTFIDDPRDFISFVVIGMGFKGGNSSQRLSVYSTPLRTDMASYLLTTYSNSSIQENIFPQDIPTYVRTFVLNSGMAFLTVISAATNETAWKANVTSGRTGRIITPNYKNPLQGDPAVPYTVTLTGEKYYNFDLRVVEADSNCGMRYSTRDSNNKWTNSSSTDLKDQILAGYSLELQIFSKNQTCGGAMLSYGVSDHTEPKSAPALTASLVLLLLSIFF